jgi:hypothetical protein
MRGKNMSNNRRTIVRFGAMEERTIAYEHLMKPVSHTTGDSSDSIEESWSWRWNIG